MDETLREGDSRGYHPHTAAARYRVLKRIHDITGIEHFCLGMAVTSPVERETLALAVRAVGEGELSEGFRAHVFSMHEIAAPTREFLAGLSDAERRHVIIDYAITATAPGQRPMAEPWLYHLDIRTGGLRQGAEAVADAERIAQRSRWLIEALAGLRSLGQRDLGVIVQDAFRCPIDELSTLVEAALEGGAHGMRLHDTVGIATPESAAQRIAELLRRFPGAQLNVHFHNDFGLATANTLAALAVGASGADVCATGLGNRAGNARTAEVVMGLKHLYNVHLPRVQFERLTELARETEAHFRIADCPVTPITGRLLHVDEASIRTHAMEEGYTTFFLPYPPSAVGGRLEAAHSDSSGRQAVFLLLKRHREQLAGHRIPFDDALVDRAFGWLTRQRMSRAERAPHAWATYERYVAELRATYVTDEDVVHACLHTRGTFDTTGTA
ncbi:MAG TPA: hypothetical protein VFT22_36985 [Kofleriaceae bacterium]|nr:hypothetical protein [Kofleriaceae bacterium]